MLLCIFAGLTATALEKLLAEIRKTNSEDTTATRMFSLLQANCVASIIFVMVHFILSLVRRAAPLAHSEAPGRRTDAGTFFRLLARQGFLMGRWFTSAPPGTLFGIVCTLTSSNMCLLLSMASPLVAYDIEMVRRAHALAWPLAHASRGGAVQPGGCGLESKRHGLVGGSESVAVSDRLRAHVLGRGSECALLAG